MGAEILKRVIRPTVSDRRRCSLVQNMPAYRNRLLLQQWRRDRAGISPGSERSREIQQQLNQPGSR
jgi:hypothetical protein